MTRGAIILLDGFPGVGKYTIAKELAKLLPGSRVLDGHLLESAARAIHDKGSEGYKEMYHNLLEATLSSLPHDPELPHPPPGYIPPIYIITKTLLSHSPFHRSLSQLLLKHPYALIHIILTASTDINITRLTSSGRLGSGKTMDEEKLMEVRMDDEVLHYTTVNKRNVEGLSVEVEVDCGGLTAEEAAGRVGEYALEACRREGWWFQLTRPRRQPQPQEARI